MPKRFHLDGMVDGDWCTLQTIQDNHQRFVRLALDRRLEGVEFVLDETWGGEREHTRVYAFYVD